MKSNNSASFTGLQDFQEERNLKLMFFFALEVCFKMYCDSYKHQWKFHKKIFLFEMRHEKFQTVS